MSRTGAHLERVEDLIADGAPNTAVAVLRRCLASRNPHTARVDAATQGVAERYVTLTMDDPSEAAAIGWAVYLYRAAHCLRSATAIRAHDRGRLVVELARRRGMPSPTADLLSVKVSNVDGGTRAGRAVADRFAMVALLHGCGLCEPAESEALAALCQWAPHHDDAPDVTYTYLVETLAALDHCGRVRQAESVLNAYGAVLPEAGTEADAFLRSYVRLRLGNRRDIQRHQKVCSVRGQRARSSFGDLRGAVIRLLAHDGRPERTP